MEQIRRVDNNKRQKLLLITKFENLSNELLFEIFEYLYFHESLYLNKIQCNAIEIILNSLKSLPMLTSLATKPNKRKHYILYDQINETNVNLINHLEIQNIKSIENFLGCFPNVNKLTLSDMFNMPRNFIQNNFNQIIPLKQLTKLILHCHHFLFE
ncbi:unnamed protein product [Adineta steineri]|uniref:Uncharacterized protein n=1 Tax=Adineta steineri TaxID=433720 RepID=A0A818TUJ4_9BILA|nr:unnamed protein product [Adineta steineri]